MESSPTEIGVVKSFVSRLLPLSIDFFKTVVYAMLLTDIAKWTYGQILKEYGDSFDLPRIHRAPS